MVNKRSWSEQFFRTNPVFTTAELKSAAIDASVSASAANDVLKYYRRTHKLQQLRRGLWYVNGDGDGHTVVDPFLVGAKATSDSTICLHSAMELHGAVYSSFRIITYFTTLNPRVFEVDAARFQPVKYPHQLVVDDTCMTHTTMVQRGNGMVRVTSRERSLVDMFDRQELCGGIEEVWRSAQQLSWIDDHALIDYLEIRKSALLAARVGYFLESNPQFSIPKRSLQVVQGIANSAAGPFRLVPSTRGGVWTAQWNLVVPQAAIDQSWEEASQW